MGHPETVTMMGATQKMDYTRKDLQYCIQE